MNRIAAGFLRKRMKQQAAFHWIGGRDQLGNDLEVSAGLFFSPRGASRGKRLQAQTRIEEGMAVIAAHAIFSSLEENRLNANSVGLKIKGRLWVPRGTGRLSGTLSK